MKITVVVYRMVYASLAFMIFGFTKLGLLR